jgi:hypothetical protein
MQRTTFALASLGLALLSSPAMGQQPGASPGLQPMPDPDARSRREGLMLGFGVGGGNISAECAADAGDVCDEVLEAGSFSGQIGLMIAPRLGVMLDVWPMVHHEDLLTITHVITTAAAQYWITPALWIKGGIGGAHARFHYDRLIFPDYDEQTDTVAAVMVAAGYEIYAKRNLAIDLQLRGGTGFYEEDEVKGHSAAFQVGFNWY